MSNDLTNGSPQGDDGFSGSLSSRLARSNNYLRWTDAGGWIDRDGLAAPSPLLVPAVDEGLQKWKDNRQEMILDKPLPDVDQLNAAIPVNEWEKGIDGQPRKPWQKVVIVYLIDPDKARTFKYTAPTTGARVAYDLLVEQVMTMRALRGINVVPVVRLEDRPFKTNFGMRKRPHFEIIGWKAPGSSGGTPLPVESQPQITGPTGAAVPTPQLQPEEPKAKPAVNLDANTLDAMADVEPATSEEILQDQLPW